MKPRKRLEDDVDRDDLKQTIAQTAASIQRERNSADQHYVRARNMLAYITALFTAVQVAFLSNLGRTTGPKDILLITSGERGDIARWGTWAFILIIVAAAFLIAVADRPRKYRALDGESALDAYLDPNHHHQDEAVLEVLLGLLVDEDGTWAASNRKRAFANGVLALITFLAAAATFLELGALYGALK